MEIRSRRHAVKEIKNISHKNLKKAEQMNKLETAKMDKTLDIIDRSTRYQLWYMERYMQKLVSKVKGRKQESVISYVTKEPTHRKWSESNSWELNAKPKKDDRHSQLLQLSKQHESRALVNATACLEKIKLLAKPVSLPPIKCKDTCSGQIHWLIDGV